MMSEVPRLEPSRILIAEAKDAELILRLREEIRYGTG